MKKSCFFRTLNTLLAITFLFDSVSVFCMHAKYRGGITWRKMIQEEKIRYYGVFAFISDDVIKKNIFSYADIKTMRNIHLINKRFNVLVESELDKEIFQNISFYGLRDQLICNIEMPELLKNSRLKRVIEQMSDKIKERKVFFAKIRKSIFAFNKYNFRYFLYEHLKKSLERLQVDSEKMKLEYEERCQNCLKYNLCSGTVLAIYFFSFFILTTVLFSCSYLPLDYENFGQYMLDLFYYFLGVGALALCDLPAALMLSLPCVEQPCLYPCIPNLILRIWTNQKTWDSFFIEKYEKAKLAESKLEEIVFEVKPRPKMKDLLERIRNLEKEMIQDVACANQKFDNSENYLLKGKDSLLKELFNEVQSSKKTDIFSDNVRKNSFDYGTIPKNCLDDEGIVMLDYDFKGESEWEVGADSYIVIDE